MKALIVFGTRYGATAGNAEEIKNILNEEGFEVRLANAKNEKVKDISEYDLVIVGSGMKMFRWVGEAEKFLRDHSKALQTKKLAIFVSSGAKAIQQYDDDQAALTKAWNDYLVEKTVKYSLNPVSMAIFGGVWDYDKMGFLFKKTMQPFKEKLREVGIEETAPGVFDTRDMDEVRTWTRDLVEKVRW